MREPLPFADDDDFELMERDFDEFLRRGLEEFKWEQEQKTNPREF